MNVSDEISIRTPTYRVQRARRMDPATRRLALIAAILGGTLFAVIGAWSLVSHHHHGAEVRIGANEVPVIQPPSGPMRVKPTNPGGMQLSAAEQDLFGGSGDGSDDQGKLAPAPETPDPAALRAPPPPPAPASAPAPTPARIVAAAAPAPAPAPVVATPAPAPAPVAKPVGRIEVQLAALPTEQAAKDEWSLLQRKMPDLKARSPLITPADVNGKTWYRLRTGGFADPAAAKTFCDQARGKGLNCDVPRA